MNHANDRRAGAEVRRRPWSLLPASVVGGLLVVLAAPAEARWSEAAASSVQANWELIRQAAWMAGIEDQAPLLAAVLAQETDPSPRRSRQPGQNLSPSRLSWSTWGPLLRARGVASGPEDLLIDTYTGLLATAVVLEQLHRDHPDRPLDVILCLYSMGPRALALSRTCEYSREILFNLSQVHRVVWRYGDARETVVGRG